MPSTRHSLTATTARARSLLARGYRYGRTLLARTGIVARPADPLPSAARHSGRIKWAPALHVDVEVPADAAQRLLEATAQVWHRLGETDAHWSVLTRDDFRRDVFGGQAEADFYKTGEHDRISLTRIFERAGAVLGTVQTVFELGCGVGRVTEALAAGKSRILAVDISAPHLALARERMSRQAITNVEFRQIKSLSDFVIGERFDLVYTVLVLQHNPPPVAYGILSHLLDLVAEEGYILFQVPTYIFNYRFSYKDYRPEKKIMEMHCIPMNRILGLLHEKKFTLLEVFEDGSHGSDNLISSTFLARRALDA